MEQKSILICLTYYLPNISGLTRHASILAEELVKRNYKVTVICSKSHKDMAKNQIINGVEIKRVDGFYFGKGFIMPLFLFKAIELVKKNEVINCHLPSIEALILAILSKLYRKRLIVTYHCYFETGNKLLDWCVNLTQNWICQMADKIVVNTKDYIRGNYLLPNASKKIVEIYPPNIIKISKKLKIDSKNKTIGFLGRISKEKNIEILIEAITRLDNNVVLKIAGPVDVSGEEIYKQKIEKLIGMAGNKIIRLGVIDDVAKFLTNCDCLVLPSSGKFESFGLVQIEAMFNGTPCVTSNLPGLRVPIQVTGMGELFESNNSTDLAQKILLVLKNGKKYYQQKQKCLNKFGLKMAIDNYEKLLAIS